MAVVGWLNEGHQLCTHGRPWAFFFFFLMQHHSEESISFCGMNPGASAVGSLLGSCSLVVEHSGPALQQAPRHQQHWPKRFPISWRRRSRNSTQDRFSSSWYPSFAQSLAQRQAGSNPNSVDPREHQSAEREQDGFHAHHSQIHASVGDKPPELCGEAETQARVSNQGEWQRRRPGFKNWPVPGPHSAA